MLSFESAPERGLHFPQKPIFFAEKQYVLINALLSKLRH